MVPAQSYGKYSEKFDTEDYFLNGLRFSSLSLNALSFMSLMTSFHRRTMNIPGTIGGNVSTWHHQLIKWRNLKLMYVTVVILKWFKILNKNYLNKAYWWTKFAECSSTIGMVFKLNPSKKTFQKGLGPSKSSKFQFLPIAV